MTKLIAYSHPQVTKDLFLSHIRRHAELDHITQGQYGTFGEADFRGCAVGCSLESVGRLIGADTFNVSTHAAYETYLGLPRILARLEDRIFEGLSQEDAKAWPLQFSDAIQPGADLSGVWSLFAPWMLREIVLPCVQKPERARQKTAIERVIKGYETGWIDDKPGDAAYVAAVAAAAAAAAYAAYAADAAAANASDVLTDVMAIINQLIDLE